MTDTVTAPPAAPALAPAAPVIATDPAKRCTVTTKPDGKGRRCIYNIHLDTVKHVYVNRSKVKPALSAVLPTGFTLTAESVKGDDVISTRGSFARVAKPRSAEQKRVDGEAKKNMEKNALAGHDTNTEFKSLTLSRFIVPPRAVDAVLDLLRRATTLGGPAQGKVMRYRKGSHTSGNIQIQWAYVNKTPKPAKTA